MHDADDHRDRVRAHVAHVLAKKLDASDDDTDLEALGMCSITAIELMSLLRERTGLVVKATTLYKATTIAALADLIQMHEVRS